ncbi:MAG TPA: NlpC/P60 family protein [Rugosimonospora sp.]|nr:NlpC/P60 family protein [Rugosimonospora sp.]
MIGGSAALAVPASAGNQPVQPAVARAIAVAPDTPDTTDRFHGSTTITLAAYSNASVGPRVVSEALKHRGAWYRFGAAGPYRFDCSGFTLYVFRKFGVSLPHKASAQRWRGRAVSRAQARPGDLVVFSQGGSWSHVAIYVGNGYVIDAPHSGARVSVRKLWTSAVVFRRLVG